MRFALCPPYTLMGSSISFAFTLMICYNSLSPSPPFIHPYHSLTSFTLNPRASFKPPPQPIPLRLTPPLMSFPQHSPMFNFFPPPPFTFIICSLFSTLILSSIPFTYIIYFSPILQPPSFLTAHHSPLSFTLSPFSNPQLWAHHLQHQISLFTFGSEFLNPFLAEELLPLQFPKQPSLEVNNCNCLTRFTTFPC